MALPFHISGTPGFLPKIPIMIVGGLFVDLLYLLLKRNKLIASLIIGGLRTLYVGVTVIEVGRFFNIPGIDLSSKFLYSPIGIASAFILGSLGGSLGYLIYKKIENTSVLKKIQGE